jgi:hypothetical protein
LQPNIPPYSQATRGRRRRGRIGWLIQKPGNYLPQDQQHSLLLLQVSSAIIAKLAVLAKVSKLNGLLLLAAAKQ